MGTCLRAKLIAAENYRDKEQQQSGRVRPDQRRDCRLPLGGTMARTPIHPGEHLAEELKELSISVGELARQIDVPVNRITGIINHWDHQWAARNHG
jgi:hypothetical protein